MTAVTMSPVDPATILKSIAPRLNNDGGIRTPADVPELLKTMKEAEKTPARCLYACVLKATKKDEVLRSFISSGGLDTIYRWMSTAQEHSNYVFVVDLLKVLRQLPVTVDDLRNNKDTAKMIRKLSKSEINSDVRELSQQLMDTWKRDVIGTKDDGERKGEEKEREKEKAKLKEKEREKEKERKLEKSKSDKTKDSKDRKSVKTTVKTASKENKNSHKSSSSSKVPVKSSPSNASSETSKTDIAEKSEKGKATPSISEKEKKKEAKKDRPKTVKAFDSKFRSTGLEGDEPAPKPGKKKSTSTDSNKSSFKIPMKRDSNVGFDKSLLPPEKKPRSSPSSSPTHSSPSSSPAHSSSASSAAADKLRCSEAEEQQVGKIKIIPAKPLVQESSGFMDSLLSDKRSATRIRKRKNSSDNGKEKPPTPTSPTGKVSAAPSFYKDTLSSVDAAKKDEDASANSEARVAGSTEAVKETSGGEDTGNASSAPSAEAVPMETATTTSGSKAPKKTVRWKPEAQLVDIRFFEMDETERINVNRIKEGDMRTWEIEQERQAMGQLKRSQPEDDMSETISWRRPAPISGLPPAPVEAGLNSTEKATQAEREKSVLSAFFDSDRLPESPQEPEPENLEIPEPKTIPLDDPQGADGTVIDWSGSYAPVAGALPATLTNLLNQAAGSGGGAPAMSPNGPGGWGNNQGASPSNNGINGYGDFGASPSSGAIDDIEVNTDKIKEILGHIQGMGNNPGVGNFDSGPMTFPPGVAPGPNLQGYGPAPSMGFPPMVPPPGMPPMGFMGPPPMGPPPMGPPPGFDASGGGGMPTPPWGMDGPQGAGGMPPPPPGEGGMQQQQWGEVGGNHGGFGRGGHGGGGGGGYGRGDSGGGGGHFRNRGGNRGNNAGGPHRGGNRNYGHHRGNNNWRGALRYRGSALTKHKREKMQIGRTEPCRSVRQSRWDQKSAPCATVGAALKETESVVSGSIGEKTRQSAKVKVVHVAAVVHKSK